MPKEPSAKDTTEDAAERAARKLKSEPAPAYRYIGGGDNYSGIPARDLSAEEYARLSEADQELVANSALYEREGA